MEPEEEDVNFELGFVNRCAEDPAGGIDLVNKIRATNDPELIEQPFVMAGEAFAYCALGRARIEQSLQDDGFEPFTAQAETLRNDVGITDQDLDQLEFGLTMLRRAEQHMPEFFQQYYGEERGNALLDLMGIALGRCRPGRMQECYGQTSLLYLGPGAIAVHSQVEHREADIIDYCRTRFSFDETIRYAALATFAESASGDYDTAVVAFYPARPHTDHEFQSPIAMGYFEPGAPATIIRPDEE